MRITFDRGVVTIFTQVCFSKRIALFRFHSKESILKLAAFISIYLIEILYDEYMI